IRFHYWFHASFADFFAMLTHGALGKICNKIEPESGSKWQNLLIQGIPNLISKIPVELMYELKLIYEKDKIYQDLFLLSSDEIWSELNSNTKYKELKSKIDSYLANWGFRCSG